MQRINEDNFKAGVNSKLEELFAAETKEELDRAMAKVTRDLQTYANIRKEIIEFNELYVIFEDIETN